MQQPNDQPSPWNHPVWYENNYPPEQQQPPSQAQPAQWGNQTSWGNVQPPFPPGNHYQPQQPPFPPQQAFPPQPGQSPYTQYPNYQPQPGQYPPYQSRSNWPMAPQYNPQLQMPASRLQQPKKGHGPLFWMLIVFGILIVPTVIVALAQSASQSSSTNTSSINPAPTVSEDAYKASTTTITLDNLDKAGNQDKGMDVHFTCKILSFVKDSNGDTVGANIEPTDSYSFPFVQIYFPSGTDLTKLNEGDVVEVWGTDRGVFNEQNAFGATVQEVVIEVQYMTDTTTSYQAP